MMRTVQDLVDWSLTNRYGDAFKNWSEVQVQAFFIKAHKAGTIYVNEDDKGNIQSIVVLQVDVPSQSLYVELLLGPRGTLTKLVNILRPRFADYTVFAMRKGTVVPFYMLWTQHHKARASLRANWPGYSNRSIRASRNY